MGRTTYYALDVTAEDHVDESDAAWKVRVHLGDGTKHEIWLPKSQTRWRTATSLEVPGWLLEKKETEVRGQIMGTRETNG
jgi:hypothetical protein